MRIAYVLLPSFGKGYSVCIEIVVLVWLHTSFSHGQHGSFGIVFGNMGIIIAFMNHMSKLHGLLLRKRILGLCM